MITDNPRGLMDNVDQLKKLRGLAAPLHVMLIDLETNFYPYKFKKKLTNLDDLMSPIIVFDHS